MKSRVIGTASGLYYQDGEILRPIIATDSGKLINIPVSWKNNHAIDVFKLVEGLVMSKSVEELFKDAPPEATHYCIGAINGSWRDLSGPTWKFFRDSDSTWHDSGDKTSSLIHNRIGLKLIERPQPKPWSGPEDGLPPVGMTIEYSRRSGTNGKWYQTHINFISGQHVIYIDSDGDEVRDNPYDVLFRPMRTPEQLAAEKRESAIREVMDIAQVDCRVTAARLVDAGFKREVV